MDEIEQRLTAAMTARAELVTEESLGDDELPAARPRRWPVLVAAAAVVIAVAGIVAGTNWPRAEPPANRVPPPAVTNTGETTTPSPPPTTGSSPANGMPAATGTSRPPSTSSSTTSMTSETPPPPPPNCGAQPCTLVAGADVAGDRVELWAGPDGADWQIRVGGVVLPNQEGGFAAHLACSVVAGRPVCLVHTWDLGDSDNQVGLERRDGWRFTGATFLTPYGAERIEPRDLYGNGSIEVVSAETRNDNGLWTAQVWRWDGSRLGCTQHVDAKEKLPGWPAVSPDVTTLALANCWGG
jgi:hypothetical protein